MKKKTALGSLLGLTKPYIWPILLCALLLVAINASELVKPYLLEGVIDRFLVDGETQSGINSITGFGIIYFVVAFAGSALSVVQVNLLNVVGQKIVRALRSRVFEHIMRMPLKKLDKYSSGRLVTRGTNDVEAVSEFFTDVLLGLAKDIILICGIVVMMLLLNYKLALISFTIIPVIVAVIYSMRHVLRPMHKRIKALTGRINGFFAENMSGMALVQVFNREKETMGLFRRINNDYYRQSLTRVIVNSVNRPVMDVINALAICIIFWYATPGLFEGGLKIGVVYAFTTYIKQFFQPIMDFSEKYDTIQSAETSAERIFELLDDEEDQEEAQKGVTVQDVKGDIEFRDVWFAYEGENWVLKGVSFTIRAGQHAAFVGQTGSGKTTIISLLTRMYEINRGQILLDGVDIREINLLSLRRCVATVLQEPFMFSGTVRDNIDLSGQMQDEEVFECAHDAGIDSFIEELPYELDEPVTERGATFSTGQRQLLSFARALASDPAVLVLDEATAHVDTTTESKLQTALEESSKGRTLLAVAHRLSTIEGSDIIFVLREGVIAESGSHEALLAQRGYYYSLHMAGLGTVSADEN